MFFGLNFHLSKIVLADISFIEAIAWRFTLASVTLFLLAYKNLKSLRFNRSNIKDGFLVGGVGSLGFNLFSFH